MSAQNRAKCAQIWGPCPIFLSLQVPTIGSKKDFKDFIKAYVGKLVDKVSETDADKGKALKANPGLQEFVKMLLADFKQLRFYAGDEDEFDLEGGVMFISQACPDGEEKDGTPITAYILKDGLYEEKC